MRHVDRSGQAHVRGSLGRRSIQLSNEPSAARFWADHSSRAPAAVTAGSPGRDSQPFPSQLPDLSRARASKTVGALAELGRERAWGRISQHEYEVRSAILLAPPTLVSREAEGDLRRLSRDQLESVRLVLASIGAPQTAAAHVRSLEDRPPWLWIRSGAWRIVYRRSHGEERADCWVVARILDEGDLDAAARAM